MRPKVKSNAAQFHDTPAHDTPVLKPWRTSKLERFYLVRLQEGLGGCSALDFR